MILFVKDSEKVEQSCVVEPSAMEKAIMNPDGCIYNPPYYANYIYRDFDSVSCADFKNSLNSFYAVFRLGQPLKTPLLLPLSI